VTDTSRVEKTKIGGTDTVYYVLESSSVSYRLFSRINNTISSYLYAGGSATTINWLIIKTNHFKIKPLADFIEQ
jgi:hypothetical protein